jgi:pyruvate/2-oxoglutarate dehydrogenase complex dihydrolipoamide acyltransferase (E2) component
MLASRRPEAPAGAPAAQRPPARPARRARHRRLRRGGGDRGLRQARRQRQGRAEPDHGRERQGFDGDPVVACRRGAAQGQVSESGGGSRTPCGGACGGSRRPLPRPSPQRPRPRRCRRTGSLLPHASPSIRRLARELGVPLAEVKGSGPKGRITQDDVQGFVKGVMAGGADRGAEGQGTGGRPAAGGGFPGLLAWPQVDFAKFGPSSARTSAASRRSAAPTCTATGC